MSPFTEKETRAERDEPLMPKVQPVPLIPSEVCAMPAHVRISKEKM
jgi:hypothetical protein